MKTNRRSFFKIAGVAGAGVFSGGLSSCASKAESLKKSNFAFIEEEAGRNTHSFST